MALPVGPDRPVGRRRTSAVLPPSGAGTASTRIIPLPGLNTVGWTLAAGHL